MRKLAAALLCFLLCSCTGGDERPSILLISIDTLRADRLGCYGHYRPTTPEIDKLAASGVLFEEAYAPSPWTLPSHASLMTATYPSTHGAMRRKSRIDPSAPTLASAFRAAGYRTAAVVNGGYLQKKFGLDVGFDHYDSIRRVKLKTGRIVNRAIAWLRQNRDRPFFLFVHTYEPHTPYCDRRFAEGLDPGRIGERFTIRLRDEIKAGKLVLTAEEKRYAEALYDGDIAFADHEFGRLFRWLKGVGLYDRIIIAVVSDHGEEHGEHYPMRYASHNHTMHREVIRVPLILRYPPRLEGGTRIATQARLIDLAPTLLELAGLPPLAGAEGSSLLPLIEKPPGKSRLVFAEGNVYGPPLESVRTSQYLLIRKMGPAEKDAQAFPPIPDLSLYDVRSDPGEKLNLAAKQSKDTAALAKLLDEFRKREKAERARSNAVIDEKTLEDLRALGYLQ